MRLPTYFWAFSKDVSSSGSWKRAQKDAPPPFSLSAWTFDGSYRTQNSVGNPSEHGPSKGPELTITCRCQKSVCRRKLAQMLTHRAKTADVPHRCCRLRHTNDPALVHIVVRSSAVLQRIGDR